MKKTVNHKIDSLSDFIKKIEIITSDYSLYDEMIDKVLNGFEHNKEDVIFKKNFLVRELEHLLDWYNQSDNRTNFDWNGEFDSIENKIRKAVVSGELFSHAEILENVSLMRKIELYQKKIDESVAATKAITKMAEERKLLFFLTDERKEMILSLINKLKDNVAFNDVDRNIFNSIRLRIEADPTPLDNNYYSDFFTVNDCDRLCKKLQKFEETKDLIKSIYEVKIDIRNPVKPFQFFYRGESSVGWPLLPSALRDDYTWDKESFYYHEIQARCPLEFVNSSFLNNLVTMQHYGCPTRLLDISSSPLIALYFACESNDDVDGKILVFPMMQGTMAYPDSDKALILSCLSHFSKNEQKIYTFGG